MLRVATRSRPQWPGTTNYDAKTSDCEPFSVKKGNLTLVTDIHNDAHLVVTEVPVNGIVHDTGKLGGANANFNPDLTKVSFAFFNTINCTGNSVAVDNVGNEGTYVAKSADKGPLASGAYSFKAAFAGDDNYNAVLAANVACEPLRVRTFGKTMGYWGNNNGQARLVANNAFAQPQAVELGLVGKCYVEVTSAAISKTILPPPNGLSLISACDATQRARQRHQRELAQHVAGSDAGAELQHPLRQRLHRPDARSNGLHAWLTPLTSASTVNDTLTQANDLIGNAKSGAPTVTQGQIGAMNTLLGCINERRRQNTTCDSSRRRGARKGPSSR